MSTFENDHIALERLSDWVDGRLSAADARDIERHLSLCANCAGTRERLVDLIAEARRLPDTIEPPAELWTGLRARLSAPPATVRSSGTARRWQLAAAAVLLVALSAGVTALLLRRPSESRTSPDVVATRNAGSAPPPRFAAARRVAADYETTIRQLRETLDERRAQLDPGTVAKVEASLRVIDSAIAEARGALAADPANLTLVDLLAASYERKLELLRRASELSSSI